MVPGWPLPTVSTVAVAVREPVNVPWGTVSMTVAVLLPVLGSGVTDVTVAVLVIVPVVVGLTVTTIVIVVVAAAARLARVQVTVPLDWLHVLGSRDPPYLHDKVIGLISAAGGTQGLQAINTMEFSVRALRGWAVPYVVPVAAAARVFDGEGRIRDDAVARQLETLGGEVVRVAGRFAADDSLHRQVECAEAAERVAAVA